MKITITGEGEPAVGISGMVATIELNIDGDQFDKEERTDIRKQLKDCFESCFDEEIDFVCFEDECPNCFSLLVEGDCKEKNCISKP